MRKKAFTLIEILIVVSVLGILAALVVPEFQDYSQKAKESNAKANLKILRNAIERYAAQHNGVPPGYFLNGDESVSAPRTAFINQLIKATNLQGRSANPGTVGYPFGPYLTEIPANPFSGFNAINVLVDGQELPTQPLGDEAPPFAWIYKISMKIIKFNQSGEDSQGVLYFDY